MGTTTGCAERTAQRRIPERRGAARAVRKPVPYRDFFLWRFFRKRFLRLCVAILWRFLFFPQGIVLCFFVVQLHHEPV
ncbi:MAG: hypothetical protein KDC03_18540, partial [Flavobacteriales bacterium]|nr:hypothetical protein [Flavobacteriales bacterium]